MLSKFLYKSTKLLTQNGEFPQGLKNKSTVVTAMGTTFNTS